MLKRGGILVCLLVVAMDVVATILAIVAEIEQRKLKQLRLLIFECKEPSHRAFVLGLVAAILMVLAHLIATLLGGCLCKSKEVQKDSNKRKVSVFCLVISWILLVIGLVLLGFGAKSNNKSKVSCGFSNHSFFRMGAIVCFIHGAFCVAYYAFSTTGGYEGRTGSRA